MRPERTLKPRERSISKSYSSGVSSNWFRIPGPRNSAARTGRQHEEVGMLSGSSGDLPYSGGAQGPSPFATRSAIWLYHSSLVLPCRSPMTVMVMLSHPTPPVSLLEARQLSIMFSEIWARGCLAAMPLRTNSTTAWEDWQSQIPLDRLTSRLARGCNSRRHTITGNHEELIIIGQLVNGHIGVCGDDLLFGRELRALLEFKVTDSTGQGKVAIDTTEVDEAASSGDTSLLAYCNYLSDPILFYIASCIIACTYPRSGACGRMKGAWHVP